MCSVTPGCTLTCGRVWRPGWGAVRHGHPQSSAAAHGAAEAPASSCPTEFTIFLWCQTGPFRLIRSSRRRWRGTVAGTPRWPCLPPRAAACCRGGPALSRCGAGGRRPVTPPPGAALLPEAAFSRAWLSAPPSFFLKLILNFPYFGGWDGILYIFFSLLKIIRLRFDGEKTKQRTYWNDRVQ